MKGLLDNSQESDMKFLVENQRIYANKCICACRVNYFASMFEYFAERDLEEITITEVSYDAFKRLLEFLYTDNVEDLSLENVGEVLIASCLFNVNGLRILCENLIIPKLSVENVTVIEEASMEYGSSRLTAACLLFKRLRKMNLHLESMPIQSNISFVRKPLTKNKKEVKQAVVSKTNSWNKPKDWNQVFK